MLNVRILLLLTICAQSIAAIAQANDFDQTFVSVPRIYRVMQYAMGGSGKLNERERCGIARPVCAVSGNKFTKGQYLHDEAEWKRLVAQVRGALDRGMNVWLFDERGYPSGGAGDLVEQHPECENICLYRKTARRPYAAANGLSLRTHRLQIHRWPISS